MSSTVAGLSVDCADAAAVARFWAAALGRQVAVEPTQQNAVVSVGADPASGPRLAFHQVPEPKTLKNRLHLDLLTTDFEAESARLIGLGARKVRDVEETGARWTTFADVEGNEFDLIVG
ncbi:MAG: glyoxalase/bleomycin resistance/dioxygenase family protein [Frankiales bacterium]|nr:glyoxalase/bleomycin resistance/dioxygenase family protein [Frankiales bacterium]